MNFFPEGERRLAYFGDQDNFHGYMRIRQALWLFLHKLNVNLCVISEIRR